MLLELLDDSNYEVQNLAKLSFAIIGDDAFEILRTYTWNQDRKVYKMAQDVLLHLDSWISCGSDDLGDYE